VNRAGRQRVTALPGANQDCLLKPTSLWAGADRAAQETDSFARMGSIQHPRSLIRSIGLSTGYMASVSIRWLTRPHRVDRSNNLGQLVIYVP
jgi:hypothetical protein